jgi:hypothetical protein
MSLNNSSLIDDESLTFSVLDIAQISLFQGYLWQAEDINEPSARGTSFFAFEDPPEISVASVTFADVSGDHSEPDIGLVNTNDEAAVDQMLRNAVESKMRVVKWMGSKLNVSGTSKALVTAYTIEDGSRVCQYIAWRSSQNGRRYVAIGSFDVEKRDPLEALVFGSLGSIQFADF